MWFRELTGFDEHSIDNVADQFAVKGNYLISAVNGRKMRHGHFETSSLAELRERTRDIDAKARATTVTEVVADVQMLHMERANAGAFFQVASQFNTLEMVSPTVTPEEGISRYEHDRTQGPACAMACGAGTIFRNYLVPVGNQIGQTATQQINCAEELLRVLDVEAEISNGYAFIEAEALAAVDANLKQLHCPALDNLMGHLKIGIQIETEVTLKNVGHSVTQAYCSAFPVAYSACTQREWELVARLVLEASYESVFRAAILNARKTSNHRLYLTLIGAGVFGNHIEWILDAIERCLTLFSHAGLAVFIVSYGESNPHLRRFQNPERTWASDLFETKPTALGLHSESFLWEELSKALGRKPKPRTLADLQKQICVTYTQLTGISPDDKVLRVPIERYYGSCRYIEPVLWRDRLIPLLLERFSASCH